VFYNPNTIECFASDTLCGYKNNEQMASMRTKLHKMSVAETGGLPYILKLLLDKLYMITSTIDIDIDMDIDIDNGLANAAVGTPKYMEWGDVATDNELRVKRVWLHLQTNVVGKAARITARPLFFANPGVACSNWTPKILRIN
jgi:hypothetical protein